MEAGQGMGREGGDDAGLPVRGRAEVEGDPAGDQLATEFQVVDRARAVGDPLRVDRQRAADLRGAAPLAGVDRDPEAAGSRSLEGCRVEQWIGEALLGAGEVPAGQSLVDEPRRGRRQPDVCCRIV